ncbi:hypothetical protein A7982_13516 [Minicystis rosea]|nr:hypothetical protein A7982_13516 [Minicystis rosea]
MHAFLRSALVAAGLVALASSAVPALAGDTVKVIVLREHGVGTATQAQPYLDKLMAVAAKENGWSAAQGQYQNKRADAEAWIKAESPRYGILSLPAFLAMKGKHNLEPIGQAIVAQGGGQQYFLISKTASDLAGCKGKKLVSDHADDRVFVDKVASGGQFTLADFSELEVVSRPALPIKKVANDEAVCALIDDAQLAELGKMGAAGVKQVWAGPKLPPMPVVAFPSAPEADKKTFQANLPKLCTGAGKQACDEVGFTLKSASAADYASVVSAYNK